MGKSNLMANNLKDDFANLLKEIKATHQNENLDRKLASAIETLKTVDIPNTLDDMDLIINMVDEVILPWLKPSDEIFAILHKFRLALEKSVQNSQDRMQKKEAEKSIQNSQDATSKKQPKTST